MKINMNEILEYIQKNIPITKELKVSIGKYSGDSIVINAPLAANINHKNTAFGGSLSSIAILSAWALLFVKQKELNLDATLVIQESKFSFLFPVSKDFQALAYAPSEEDFTRFLKILNRKGKARLKIYSEIVCDGKVCGSHEGSYVAVKNT